VIHLEGLTKRYKKADRNAVDGLSFEVRAGEFFALLGPNGAGKSTTISILTTTLSPTGGTATIDGHDIVREASAVRRIVGIIFQRPSLDMNLTAEENVRFHAILYGLYPYAPTYGLMPAAYREQVLVAFRDVEDQLASLRLLADQAGAQKVAVDAASRATKLSDARYRNGLVSQLELLDARRSELANRRAAVQVRAAQYQATVGLIRALGGGWGEPPAPTAAAASPAKPA